MIILPYSRRYVDRLNDEYNISGNVYLLMSDKFGWTAGSTRFIVGKIQKINNHSFTLNYISPGEEAVNVNATFRMEPGRSIILLSKEEAETYGYIE
jgi:hypothetical protein